MKILVSSTDSQGIKFCAPRLLLVHCKRYIAIVIQIFFISVTYADAENNHLKHYSVTPEKLNIRLEPNIQADIIGSLKKNQKIDILEVKDGWAKIHQCNDLLNKNSNNLLNKNINTCWVSIDYLFPIAVKQLKTESNIVKWQQKIFSQTNLIVLLIFIVLCLFLYTYIWKKITIKCLTNINKNNPVSNDSLAIDDNLSTQILEIKNQLNALQNYSLDSKEKIKRFENGYDWKIQKEFVIDIIDTIEYLEKQNKKIRNNDLETAIEDLNVMLENNGIYKIELDADNYKGQEIMAKVASIELTDNTSKDYAIKEVLKDGYYIEINEKQKVIKPAEVIIYKIKEKE